jgi:hypothetical protein
MGAVGEAALERHGRYVVEDLGNASTFPYPVLYHVVRGASPERVVLGASDLDFEPAWLGEGYGHPTPQGATAIEQFRREGVVLEPVYTAKAAAALIEDGMVVAGTSIRSTSSGSSASSLKRSLANGIRTTLSGAVPTKSGWAFTAE